MRKKISRKFFTFGAAALIAVALAYAFRPLPLEVDMEEVVRRPMTLKERYRVRVVDIAFAPLRPCGKKRLSRR